MLVWNIGSAAGLPISIPLKIALGWLSFLATFCSTTRPVSAMVVSCGSIVEKAVLRSDSKV